MSVYKHQQGSYRSYRVARSIDGELHQAYFPRTREGYRQAKAQDEKWERAQKRAQRKFTGPARRWAPKAATTKRGPVAATRGAASKAGATTKSASTAKDTTRSAAASKSAKQPAKSLPAKRGPARAPAKARSTRSQGRARSNAKS